MAISSKGRTFELWVLNRWVSKFCVRSTPLRLSRKPVNRITVYGIIKGAVNAANDM